MYTDLYKIRGNAIRQLVSTVLFTRHDSNEFNSITVCYDVTDGHCTSVNRWTSEKAANGEQKEDFKSAAG